MTEIRGVFIGEYHVRDGGNFLFNCEPLNEFARADGFSGWAEMKAWFSKQYGLPYSGYLHKWRLKEKEINNG